jgi:hypothetical protein
LRQQEYVYTLLSSSLFAFGLSAKLMPKALELLLRFQSLHVSIKLKNKVFFALLFRVWNEWQEEITLGRTKKMHFLVHL